jgi:CubicO group peptidase (beta-lactamase class C family)
MTRRRFGLALLAGPRFPGRSWEQREPGELGLDAAALDKLAVDLGGRGCVVRHGYIAKAWGSQSEIGDWLSSAKPVLSTLLLFAIHEKKVRGPDALVTDFGWDLIAKDRTMQLRHLANMVSGYARPEPPGAAWAYNDYGIQLYQKTLFDRIFREEPRQAAMAPHRLGALELEDGLEFRSTNRRMSASVRDFARIAWFWLQKGKWKGKQALPRNLVERYQRPQTPAGLPHTSKAPDNDYLGIGTYGGGSDHFTEFGAGVYGFNWWFNAKGRLHPERSLWPDAPPDTFMSIGAGGNCAVMIPSRSLILAAARANWGPLAGGDESAPMNRHIKLLVSAVR